MHSIRNFLPLSLLLLLLGGGHKTLAANATPDVALKILDYDGLQKLIVSHKGQVVVVDAWSTSCLPCVREFPKLVALSQQHAADKLACISLSFDFDGDGKPEDQSPSVLAFLRRQHATFENVLSSTESDELCKKLDLAAVPAVFVYDRQGKLRKRFDNEHAKRDGGPFTYEQVGKLVDELLKE